MNTKLCTGVQMNLVSWMTLVFLLSVGSSLADVNVNWLTGVVNVIRTEYRIEEQFCLAANIPQDQDTNTLSNVLKDDRYKDVKEVLSDGEVYVGTNVVIAKPAGPVHAEPQVLKNLQTLITKREGNVLLIYTYLSPCVGKCANPTEKKLNILQDIKKNVIPNWGYRVAFVFTTVCDRQKCGRGPEGKVKPTEDELRESLRELGRTGLELRNIFRCYKPENLEFQCHSCSFRGDVSDVCVKNDFEPGQQSQQQPEQRGRSRSRSRDKGRRNQPKQRGRSRSNSGSRGRSPKRVGKKSRSSRKQVRGRSSSSSSSSRSRSSSSSRSRSSSSSSSSRSRSRGYI